MIAVNVRAPLFMIQAAAEVMRREGVAGSVVSIGSTSGHGGQPFITSYCISKGALETMTRNLAYSLMRHKIRVNQVSPGWMDTEAEDAVQRKFHGATDGWLERAEAEQPTGRLIKPQEVAKVVAFYLSDESGMLTGNIVDYDQSVQGAGDAPNPHSRRLHSDRQDRRLGVGRIGKMHAELVSRQVPGAAWPWCKTSTPTPQPRSVNSSTCRTRPTSTHCSGRRMSTLWRSAAAPTPTCPC